MKRLLTLIFCGATICAVAQIPQDLTLSTYSGQPSIRAGHSITLTNGFHIPAGSTARLFIQPELVSSAPMISGVSNNRNFVLERTFKIENVNAYNLGNTRSVVEENRKIQYIDGLGRPLQTIDIMASPNLSDIIQPFEYDLLGREKIKYQPYTSTTSIGTYRADALAGVQSSYYQNIPISGSLARTSNPYSISVFETSPLNKVLEQGAPGTNWQPATGHTIKTKDDTNVANEVLKWTLNSTGASSGNSFYDSGRLWKTTVRDENVDTSTSIGKIEEFKDDQDHIILKRIWETESKSLDTYYLYDAVGNLRYVLPPAVNANTDVQGLNAITSFTEGDSFFEQFIYGYHYDHLNRVVEKKIPGKGWEYLAYNSLDQVAMTQDAVQRGRVPQEWSFTKYDGLGRVILTGRYEDTRSVAVGGSNQLVFIQGQVNSSSPFESVDKTDGLGYSRTAFPTSNVAEYYTKNYFDSYDFPDNTLGGPDLNLGQVGDKQVSGLSTGTFVKVFGGNSFLLSVNFYDREGRLAQVRSNNHLGGTDVVNNSYNFAGELDSVKRIHIAYGNSTIIRNEFVHDHAGRQVANYQLIGNDSTKKVMLNRSEYNDLGQLMSKGLHSTDMALSFKQNITYRYNERGWLISINDPTSLSADRVFGMQLNYGDRPGSFNGNIGSVNWKTVVPAGSGLSQHLQGFNYGYDGLNRLKLADYVNPNTANKYNEELTYDVMGNIVSLKRMNSSSGYLNNLSYAYNGNRLSSVGDAVTGGYNSSYGYDDNGNQKTNNKIGLTDISYNYLNLPSSLTKGSTGEVLYYTYDASGRKLRKQLGSQITDYVDGIQYTNNVMDHIQTAEGRALAGGSSFVYEYYLKDHLGNTRAVVAQDGAIRQVQDYYTFGLEMDPGNRYLGSPANRYTYNGKEKQTELGLDQLDYGARFYDPVIGRWNVVDPLVELYQESTSPYIYVLNNPILLTDPDGRFPNGPGDDLWRGIKQGFTGYFGGIKQAVLNPVETIKSQFTPKALKDNLFNTVTMGGYGAVKEGLEIYSAASKGDLTVLGNAIGNKAAEGVVVLATEGAGKSIGALKRAGKVALESVEVGKSSKYLNETGKNSVRNIKTSVTYGEFGANLEKSGFTKIVSKDGRVVNYTKGEAKYSLRESPQTSRGTSGPSADYSYGTKQPTLKIRLNGGRN